MAERDLHFKGFPRSYRLRKSREFKAVFQTGNKVITDSLVFHLRGNGLEHSRLGLAVSRKVGKAVQRNHVKRRIREAFRLTCGSFSAPYDLVVYPRKGVLDMPYSEYLRAFEILAARIAKLSKHEANRTTRSGNP